MQTDIFTKRRNDSLIFFAVLAFLTMIPIMAAMAVAYTLGEGLGRLGCISFGCCYGKAIDTCHPLVRRIFSKTPFIFKGAT